MIGYMEMIQVDEKPAIRDNFNTVGFSASSHSGAIREAVVSENPVLRALQKVCPYNDVCRSAIRQPRNQAA